MRADSLQQFPWPLAFKLPHTEQKIKSKRMSGEERGLTLYKDSVRPLYQQNLRKLTLNDINTNKSITGIAVALWITLTNRSQHIYPFDDAAKDTVTTIQMWRRAIRDKEL